MHAKTGREFIRMIAPMIGIEDLQGIQRITITADISDCVRLDIECVAKFADGVEATTTPLPSQAESKRYIVTVDPVE
jgi:hypothetical protein